MKNLVAAVALLTAVVVVTPGCYKTLDQRAKAGVPFKKDRISGQYQRTVEQVHAATRQVLQFNGTLMGDDMVTRVLSAKVDTRTVYVQLIEVEPSVTGVTVQARNKGGTADIELAAEIEKQIALALQSGR